MAYLNTLRRNDHVRNLHAAGLYRGYRNAFKPLRPAIAAGYADQARKHIQNARFDRVCAALAGWKLP